MQLIHRLCIDLLKSACERALVTQQRLSARVEDACELLVLADLYSAPTLKAHAVSVLRDNHARVLTSTEWLQMQRARPQLAAETLRALFVDTAGGVDHQRQHQQAGTVCENSQRIVLSDNGDTQEYVSVSRGFTQGDCGRRSARTWHAGTTNIPSSVDESAASVAALAVADTVANTSNAEQPKRAKRL
jgi:hypothetical protein